MRTDALVSFVLPFAPLSLVAGAGINIPSAVLDLLGQGVGMAPGNIIGNVYNNQFGTDFGIGGDRVMLDIVIGTGLVTGDSCTLNLAVQAAADTGATGSYAPGTWQTLVETGPLTAAQCVAQTRIARFDWPPSFPETMPPPRYVRLLAQVPSGLNFTAGTIAFALATSGRDDYTIRYAARNYAVL